MVIEPGGTQLNKTGGQSPIAANGKAKANPAPNQGQASVASRQDSVSLSPQAQAMGRLESAIHSAPDVDEAKVAEMRQAIAEGRYSVDSQALAGKMLAQDDLF